MVDFETNKDEAIVTEKPFAGWAGGFAASVLIGAAAGGVAAAFKEIPLAPWMAGVLAGLVAAAFFLYFNPVTTVKVSRSGRTITVRKNRLIGYDFKVYSFAEVAGSAFVESWNGRHGAGFQLVVPLADGRKIELSAANGSRERDYDQAAELLNSYIFDVSQQVPFKLTIFND